MALLDVRLRSGYLFLVVVVGHLLLISAQVNTHAGVPVLEALAFGAFAEVQRATAGVLDGGRDVWASYVALQHVHEENEALRRQLGEAQVEIQAQRALAGRSRSLQDLLQLQNGTELKTVAAQVIGAAASPDFRTVTIDKGVLHGLQADMAVIGPKGIVGRLVVTGPRAARVQLLIDRNAAAGALIERSRAQGVVVGAADDRLRLDYVSEVSEVAVGDTVVTSGIDGIYPKGFVIGRVVSVEKNGTAYRAISVEPAVDFSSLEDVLVITTPTPRSEGTRLNSSH